MYKTNKRRYQQLIISFPETKKLYYIMKALILFLLFFTISTLIIGGWYNFKEREIYSQLFGNWDRVFLNLNKNDLEYFKCHAFVDEFSIQEIKEKCFLEGDKRVVIGSCDHNFFKISNTKILSGRMPKKEKEVAIEEEYLDLLGVKQVGDYVPDDSPVISLRGYYVCGVVDDYSSRWKVANWDIKYINCFIFLSNSDEFNVYVKEKFFAKNDLKINFIYSKENFYQKKPIEYQVILFGLLTITLIRILGQLYINKKLELLGIMDFAKKDMSRKTIYFFEKILYLVLNLILVSLIDKIIFKNNVLSIIHYNLSNSLLRFELLPIIDLKNLFLLVIYIYWLIIILYAIYNIRLLYNKFNQTGNWMLLSLEKYYFGKFRFRLVNRNFVKQNLKILILNITILWILLVLKNYEILSLQYLTKTFLICFFIHFFGFIIKNVIFLMKFYSYKRKSNLL